MLKQIAFITLVPFLLCGCLKTAPQKTGEDFPVTAPLTDDTIMPLSESPVIQMKIKNGIASVRLRKKKGQTICLGFDSGNYTHLKGRLASADPAANIRFSQIIMPNGERDGPFGREIAYELPAAGAYTLSIHENMMAGDPWEGDFDVELQLVR